MDMNASLNRAMWSAGVWVAMAYGLSALTGAQVTLSGVATEGALMGGSSYASDYIHNMLGWQATGLTSAAVTGGVFAGMQKGVRGSNSYTANFIAGFGNDYAVEYLGSMMARPMNDAA